MFAAITFWGGMALMAATCIYAIVRGGPLERQAGWVVALAWLASMLAPAKIAGPPWVVIAVDLLLFGYFLYHAAFSRRTWPVIAAGFQLLIVMTHLAFALNRDLEQWGYVSAYYVWSVAVLLALAAGTLWRGRPKAG